MAAVETVADFLKRQDMTLKIGCSRYEEVITDLEKVKSKLELLLTVIPIKTDEQPIGVSFKITNIEEIQEKVSQIAKLSREIDTIAATLKRIT